MPFGVRQTRVDVDVAIRLVLYPWPRRDQPDRAVDGAVGGIGVRAHHANGAPV